MRSGAIDAASAAPGGPHNVTLASHAIFPPPPASGTDLVDRHWAVDAMPGPLRAATLAAAESTTGAILEPAAREATHTLATAYELAALLGRDALRSRSTALAATLERDALRVGALRATTLHQALGLSIGRDHEAVLRHAVRLAALATVAGPDALARTRQWLETGPAADRLRDAEQQSPPEPAETSEDAGTGLWLLWRSLLLHPDPANVERIVAEIAAVREQRRRVVDLAPSTNETELRVRFQRFVRERLSDAAGLLAVGLRGRSDLRAICAEITAQCTAARSASSGDPNLDLLAAWLELAALTVLGPRLPAAG
jgi:hypothetical protein